MENPWLEEVDVGAPREYLTSNKYESGKENEEYIKLQGLILYKRITCTSYTKVKVSVRCHFGGIIHTETDNVVRDRYGIRVINRVHNKSANGAFEDLVSNFLTVNHTLPT